MIIEDKMIEFLSKNFVFKRFEIDEWLNKQAYTRFQRKCRVQNIENQLGVDFLASSKLQDWKIITKDILDSFVEEYYWFPVPAKLHLVGLYMLIL